MDKRLKGIHCLGALLDNKTVTTFQYVVIFSYKKTTNKAVTDCVSSSLLK